MLLLLLSSLFVLSNGVLMALQPQKNSVDAQLIKKEFNVSSIKNGFDAKSLIKELVDADPAKVKEVVALVQPQKNSVDAQLIKKEFNVSSIKNGFDAKSLIKELVDADPAKVKEVVALVEIMLQDAQADLNRLTTASTSANEAYDVAVSNYDAAVVAKTQGVAALNQAEVDAKAAKDVAYGAKTGAQDNLDAEKSRLEGEIASLQQVITILQGLSSVECAAGYKSTTDVGGWGAINGRGGGETVGCAECAILCSTINGCESYECGPTDQKCNLNKVGSVYSGQGYHDYLFCKKEIEI